MQSGAHGDTSRQYVPYLFENGVISENVFSFYLTSSSGTSYMDFGTPNSSVMKYHTDDEEGIVWLDIVDSDPWWTSYITGFYWGGVENPTLYKIDQARAIADTGTSCIMGPSLYLDWIMSHLLSLMTSYAFDDNYGYLFSCYEKDWMPSFYLLVGDYWFEV